MAYDTDSTALTQLTDENGGVWKLGAPTVTGSSDTYRGAVLGGAPGQYYRFGEAAGAAKALDEVRGGDGTYNAVTLGASGPFGDHTTASFDGSTSSSVRVSGVSLRSLSRLDDIPSVKWLVYTATDDCELF
jgi:hypothetical protein